MKKRGQYLLILGSAFALTASVAGGLTAGVLRYNQIQRWKINPYESYDFEQAKDSLLEAKIPPDLVKEYIELVKKITGVTKTNEIIKASELLNLNNQMMNSISQRMIWDYEDSSEIQEKINLAKPILIQFYEYYDHVYIYQNDLINDSLNQMQLKSANTDLYKWSIGTNISDYNYIKDYLESAKEAWISKMKMSYIFETFLNQKSSLYNSLINQANVAITEVRKQIQKLIKDKNELLNTKNDAQDHYLLVGDFLSSIESWKDQISDWYLATMIASASQLGMAWFPLVAYALAGVTLGFSIKYYFVEKAASQDLNLQIEDIHKWAKNIKLLNTIIKITIPIVTFTLRKIITEAAKLAAKIVGLILGFIGLGLLTWEYKEEMDKLNEIKPKIGNADSEASIAIKNYIKNLDQQIGDISETVDILSQKETNYMNQKILFKRKLDELLNYNKFFQNFNQMNDEIFIRANFFSLEQIKNWQKEVKKEYGYLSEDLPATSEFIKVFNKEKNIYRDQYLVFKIKKIILLIIITITIKNISLKIY